METIVADSIPDELRPAGWCGRKSSPSAVLLRLNSFIRGPPVSNRLGKPGGTICGDTCRLNGGPGWDPWDGVYHVNVVPASLQFEEHTWSLACSNAFVSYVSSVIWSPPESTVVMMTFCALCSLTGCFLGVGCRDAFRLCSYFICRM